MIQTISRNYFINKMTENYFSYEGANALFDYLEEIEEDTGIQMEFDAIALRCEYSEYTSAIDCINDREEDVPYMLDEDEIEGLDLLEVIKLQEIKALKFLKQNTIVIEYDGGIIISNY